MKEYFGLAAGRDDGRYVDFTFGGGRRSIVIDDSLLLIEPATAGAYEESIRPPDAPAYPIETPFGGSETREGGATAVGRPAPKPTGTTPAKTRFYGCASIDPILAKIEFNKIVDEVVAQFTSRSGITVTIRVEISAEDPGGFDENLKRAVRENSALLGFEPAEFEME